MRYVFQISGIRASAPLALLLLLLHAAPCAADEFSDFTNAKNAWEAGEYEVSRARFEALLAKSPTNEIILIETHKFLGVTYLFLGDEANAEEQFVRLLNRSPDFNLDPLVFPIDAVDFFTRIKRQHADRLAAMEAARLEADKAREAEEKARLEAEIERLTRTVYLQKVETRGSLITAFMPFGAGQFQNGHKKKGILFLSMELALLTSTVITFSMHASLNDDAATPFASEETKQDYASREQGLRLANRVSFIALFTVAVIGIVDSMVNYVPYRASWKTLDEKQVPPQFRTPNHRPPAIRVSPYLDDQSVGVELNRSF